MIDTRKENGTPFDAYVIRLHHCRTAAEFDFVLSLAKGDHEIERRESSRLQRLAEILKAELLNG